MKYYPLLLLTLFLTSCWGDETGGVIDFKSQKDYNVNLINDSTYHLIVDGNWSLSEIKIDSLGLGALGQEYVNPPIPLEVIKDSITHNEVIIVKSSVFKYEKKSVRDLYITIYKDSDIEWNILKFYLSAIIKEEIITFKRK